MSDDEREEASGPVLLGEVDSDDVMSKESDNGEQHQLKTKLATPKSSLLVENAVKIKDIYVWPQAEVPEAAVRVWETKIQYRLEKISYDMKNGIRLLTRWC